MYLCFRQATVRALTPAKVRRRTHVGSVSFSFRCVNFGRIVESNAPACDLDANEITHFRHRLQVWALDQRSFREFVVREQQKKWEEYTRACVAHENIIHSLAFQMGFGETSTVPYIYIYIDSAIYIPGFLPFFK